MTRTCRSFPALLNLVGVAVCLMLAACGGGGSGGGGGTTGAGGAAGTTAGTLVFNGDSFAGAPIAAVRATEQMMGFAQLVTDMTGRFVRKGAPLTLVVACTNRIGTAALTLTDRDGDGVASKGDRLTVLANGCRIGGLYDAISGDVSFELTGATAVKAGAVEGDVQLGSKVTNNGGKTWGGAFHTLRSRTAVGQSWRITTPAGTGFSYTASSQAAQITLLKVDATKMVNYETAQSTLNFAMVLDSPSGTLAITTTTPITGYLQRPPETGEVHFQGANGLVRLTTAHTASGWDVRFVFNYSGSESRSQSYPWLSLTDGLMWWDGLRRISGSDDIDSDTQEYAADSLRVELVVPPRELMTASDAVYQVQFLRPPIDLPALEYRFEDISGYGGPGWNVAATAERHGATILLRPAEPLRGGRSYAITATLGGVPWTVLFDAYGGAGKQLHDAEGHVLILGVFGSFSAPLALIPDIATSATSMASLAEKITLTASVQSAIGANLTVAHYHWSQVNGTPLRFSDPDAAVTTVTLGDVRPTGVETVQLQLTVTDSLGATEETRTTITVGDIVDRPPRMWIYGVPELHGAPMTLYPVNGFTPSYVSTRYADKFRYAFMAVEDIWDVQFGLPSAALFAPGSYAFNGAGVGLATNAPDMILQGSREAACTARTGSFKVLDAAYGVDGTPVRLAIDFTISCNGGPQLFGAYRHNSSIQILDTRTNN